MEQISADWPDDADGGVLRSLHQEGFDFSKPHEVDYNIDFKDWPPPLEAIEVLRSIYGVVELVGPSDLGAGYAEFKVFGPLSYEGVTSIQRNASAAMAPFGGVCETWGVWGGSHHAP